MRSRHSHLVVIMQSRLGCVTTLPARADDDPGRRAGCCGAEAARHLRDVTTEVHLEPAGDVTRQAGPDRDRAITTSVVAIEPMPMLVLTE